MTTLAPIPIIDGIASLAAGKDAWLVDVWGVMHNGVAPFIEACEACRRFRAQGGRVILITNAPRPAPSVVSQITQIGVPVEAYDGVLSSGDVMRGLLETWKGKPIHHLGPARNLSLFEGMGLDFATSIEAEIVVCTGLIDDDTETPEDYATTLKGFQRRGMIMLCANPDIVVERGDRIVYCAGALAQAYESYGGEVVYTGKPHLPIYELAQGMVDNMAGRPVPRDRILAIGDGMLTDMAGAAAAGIPALFIASGIHVEREQAFDHDAIEALFRDAPHTRPVAAMTGLRW